MDVGMAVTNLRVVCKSITCVSTFTESKSCWSVAGYAKDAIVGTCHCTIDGQEHKISWRAGPEQDTIFHLLTCHSVQRACKAATVVMSD